MIQLVRLSYTYQLLPPACLSSLAFGQQRQQRQEPGHRGSLSPASGRWAGSLLGPGLGRRAPGRDWRRLMRWWLSSVQRKTSAAIREKKKKDALNIYTCHAISIVRFWLSSWERWQWISVTNGKEAFVVFVEHEEHPCKCRTQVSPWGQASPASLCGFSCSSFPCAITAHGSSWSKLSFDLHLSNANIHEHSSQPQEKVWGSCRDTSKTCTTIHSWGKRHLCKSSNTPHSTSDTDKYISDCDDSHYWFRNFRGLIQEQDQTTIIIYFYKIKQAVHTDIQKEIHCIKYTLYLA